MNIVQRSAVVLAGSLALACSGEDSESSAVAGGAGDPAQSGQGLDLVDLSRESVGAGEGYQRLRLDEGMRYADELEHVLFRGIQLPTGASIVELPSRAGISKSTVGICPDQENDAVVFEFKQSQQARNAFGVDIQTTGRVYRLSTGAFEGGYRLDNPLLHPDRLRRHMELVTQAGSTAALGRLNLDGVTDDPVALGQALDAMRRLEYVQDVEITPEMLEAASKFLEGR